MIPGAIQKRNAAVRMIALAVKGPWGILRPLVVVSGVFVALALLSDVDTVGAHSLSTIDLVAQHSGRCMDVSGASTANLAGIIQHSCQSNSNQEVDITDTGGGWHEIRFRHSGKCLDVPSTENLVQLIQFQCNGQGNQRFQLASYSGGIAPIKPQHTYGLNKCVDVEAGSMADLARIIQFTCNGQGNPPRQLQPPRYRVWINPPGVGSLTDYSHLHCKFHGQCGTAGGGGLDWDSWIYTGNREAYFRVYTANLGSVTAPLPATRSANLEDSVTGCDYVDIDIFDPSIPGSKGKIRYIHTQTSAPSSPFSVALGWSQNYATTMVSETDCPWTGYHVHEKAADLHWLANLNGDARFNGGYYGDYCVPYANYDPVNDTCLRLKNNDFANWSKYYDW